VWGILSLFTTDYSQKYAHQIQGLVLAAYSRHLEAAFDFSQVESWFESPVLAPFNEALGVGSCGRVQGPP